MATVGNKLNSNYNFLFYLFENLLFVLAQNSTSHYTCSHIHIEIITTCEGGLNTLIDHYSRKEYYVY